MAGKKLVRDVLKRGEWNLVVYKSRPSRWEYTLHNPQGGSQGMTSYTSQKAAINAATAKVLWGDKKRYQLVIAKWEPDLEDFVVTKTEWRKVPTQAAASLRSRLIHLAAEHPEHREKLLPLLKVAADLYADRTKLEKEIADAARDVSNLRMPDSDSVRYEGARRRNLKRDQDKMRKEFAEIRKHLAEIKKIIKRLA